MIIGGRDAQLPAPPPGRSSSAPPITQTVPTPRRRANRPGTARTLLGPGQQTTIEARGTREGIGHFGYANDPRHDIFEIWRVRKVADRP
jgi:hypothetical protein